MEAGLGISIIFKTSACESLNTHTPRDLFCSNYILEIVIDFRLQMIFLSDIVVERDSTESGISGSWPTFAAYYLCDLGHNSLPVAHRM